MIEQSKIEIARHLTAIAAGADADEAASILADHIAVAAGLLAARTSSTHATSVLTNVVGALVVEVARECRLGRKPSLRERAIEFCERHSITLKDLQGPSRCRPLAQLRQEFMALVRDNTTLSLPQIGRFLGNRDHTTVLHGVRAHRARCAA